MSEKRLERRIAPATLKVERRAEGEAPHIVGHAAVFNRQSVDLGGFTEIIKPGAFRHAIEISDIRGLWNHNSDIVLGRNKSGTLQLEEDEIGLVVDIDPPRSATVYVETVERGDVSQMSFAFTVAASKQSWETLEDGSFLRTIFEFEELFDVSPVTYPAYPDTDVALRRLERLRSGTLLPAELAAARRGAEGDLAAMRLQADRTMLDISAAGM